MLKYSEIYMGKAKPWQAGEYDIYYYQGPWGRAWWESALGMWRAERDGPIIPDPVAWRGLAEPSDETWLCADGRQMLVGEMHEDYAKNALRMLIRKVRK